ncbi:transcriptional regulator [Salipaludibacillus neizhouensis]|uniref:Transcriptional regulator n=1 Tax=Salipaludibacillus neizhouensis TaxID=885475 RepID=A0A3A9KBN0_9BACI|nr:LacI family DNA-binding transcriptional regulator [Salipaludibacillus neizhouensis]RKL68180.1 transcriptional regulator [Salipaludibacillus neizhouensis]
MSVTIKDIAKTAGVSYSTVSKALRDSPLVKAPTKKKITAIANELGYQPNAAAQSLVSKKSQTIGVVWSSLEREAQAALLTHINKALENRQYTTLVSINEMKQAVNTFQRFQVDAILVFNENKDIPSIQASPIPILSYGIAEGACFPTVDANRQEAIRIAVDHFANEGHQNILYVGMCSENDALQDDKFSGYCTGIKKQFGPLKQALYADTSGLNRHDGYLAMKKFLSTQELPDSIIIGSYDLARGSIQALSEDSRPRVKDIPIISYDNLPQVDKLEIPLMKVGVPLEKIVETIVDSLIKMIENDVPVTTSILQPELTLITRQF